MGTMTAGVPSPTVHLLCGYNGVGKTTYAKHLEKVLPAVRFSLDEWMLRLYSDLSFDSAGYGSRAEICKDIIWGAAQQVLLCGVDVVLDWNQWSRSRRATWRDNALNAGFTPTLHFIDMPLKTAIERAAQRVAKRSRGSHELTHEGIRHLAKIFERPTGDEGMQIETVSGKFP